MAHSPTPSHTVSSHSTFTRFPSLSLFPCVWEQNFTLRATQDTEGRWACKRWMGIDCTDPLEVLPKIASVGKGRLNRRVFWTPRRPFCLLLALISSIESMQPPSMHVLWGQSPIFPYEFSPCMMSLFLPCWFRRLNFSWKIIPIKRSNAPFFPHQTRWWVDASRASWRRAVSFEEEENAVRTCWIPSSHFLPSSTLLSLPPAANPTMYSAVHVLFTMGFVEFGFFSFMAILILLTFLNSFISMIK